MKHVLLAGAVALGLGLAGCEQMSQTVSQVNVAIAQDLPTACALVSSAWAAYQTVAVTGTVNAKTQSAASQAFAGAQAICVNPSDVNAPTALPTVANAYAAIVAARSGK
ncbi:MAG TPA: hypothetical protein VFE63_22085 [Roseiarcus sp.]|jgi:hypothetical protein|nr:hypothetical protein [Roseiarcus sp.]